MLSKLSIMDLVGVAGIVGLVGSGITLVLVNHTRSKIQRQPYYLSAMQTLRRNRAALELIGEPFYARRVDLSDRQNNCFTNNSVKLKVPFSGNKKSGHLFIWADRDSDQHDWSLQRMEITFNDIHDKKVLVYKNDKQQN